MNNDNDCKHDYQAVLFCSKCKSKYHIAMVEIITQAKLDAANQIVNNIKKHTDSGKNIENAISEATNDLENQLHSNSVDVMIMGVKNE